MRILVDIGHPAHVHFYKYAIKRWQENGDEVLITVRPKDVVQDLLEYFGFPYQILARVTKTKSGLIWEFLSREWHLGRVIKDFKPDVITAIGGIFISPVAKIFRIPSVVFTDTEHVKMDRFLTYPLASVIYTPEWFLKDTGKNQIRYRGFQECAYLDPNIYKPDPDILRSIGVSGDVRFTLLRFISWEAGHDQGQSGFTLDQKVTLVQKLSEKMKVFISSEGPLPDELEMYKLEISPERLHDVLYYADLYVGEGATLATESSLLGTPAIYVSSLVGTMGNYLELARHNLVYAYPDGELGIKKALEIADDEKYSLDHNERKDMLFADLVNVTDLIVNKVIEVALAG